MEKHDDQSVGNIRERGHASYRLQKVPKPRDIGTSSVGEEEYGPQRRLNFDEDRIEEVGVDVEEMREGNEDENVETVLGDVEGADPIRHDTEKPKRRSRKKKGIDIRVLNFIPKTGPFPGGPVDNSVLPSFYEHVSLKVWLGEERGALTIVHHTKKLIEWEVQPGWVHFNDIVSLCGFGGLRDSLVTLDKSLISAFSERWQSDTSSFHMPFWEMTITLDDVKQITSLPIEGELIIGSWEMGYEAGLDLVHRCLKVEKMEIKAEFEACKTLSLRNSWIKRQMAGKEDHADAELIDASVRRYLLYCIGCTLCPDKSGTKISIAWLRYLEKLEEVHKFAWDAIALAFLYKELGAASRGNRMQIAGYLALLEEQIQKAQSILGSIISKGKGFCGKAYSEVLKARDALIMCGVPPPEAVASEEEEEASQNVYTRKRKSKRTRK